MTPAEIGTARAAADVAEAVAGLRRSVATAPEWELAERFNGTRLIVPQRAMLAGLLAHIEAQR